jgi:hypothetical protein
MVGVAGGKESLHQATQGADTKKRLDCNANKSI